MNKLLLLVALFFTLSSIAISQEEYQGPCANFQAEELLYEMNPEMRAIVQQREKDFNEFSHNFNAQNKSTPDTIYIPVVFHIIHANGSENISNEVIHESMDRLNIDFLALNDNLDAVADTFVDIIGNPQMQFRLAQYDPEGNCTTGITRTVSPLTTNGLEAQLLLQWPRNSYLNVWVVRNAIAGSPNTAAFSRRPPNVHTYPEGDGVVMGFNFMGFDERTLTHEVAHWSNIIHVWGPTNEPGLASNCNTDDDVADTPGTIGHSGGCNLTTESCGSLDNMQNYMDYTSCDHMFTTGQADRMITAFNYFQAQRNQIWTDDNLEETGLDVELQLCTADFRSNQNRICTGDEIEFNNQSGNGDTEWTWTFEGGTPESSNEENPVITYNTTGLYQVSLTIGNGVDEITETKDMYITVLEDVGAQTPILEGFENVDALPNEDWVLFSDDEDWLWEVTDIAAATGDKSVILKNYYQDDNYKDELESNPIDLSNLIDADISFRYAYAKRHSDDSDILKLKVTKSCGDIWITKETLKASNGTLETAPFHSGYFVPNDDEWGEAYVDNISALYLVENFRFKLEFSSGNGNNIFLDDINIFDPNSIGINEVNKAALAYSVFPNPVENNMTIQFNLLHNTEVVAEVYDISGRIVEQPFNRSFQLGVNKFNVNTSDWNAGVYFVKITLEGESFVEKVIKN